MPDVGKKLKQARGEKSTAQVSAELHISRSSLQMYEAGFRIPRDEIKRKLAEYYGTTVQALFFDD